MIEALHANGVQTAEGGLVVVVTDDYLRPELDTFNQQALQSKQPWLLVKPLGLVLWIGPFFHPPETGCWSCLAQRLRANRQTEKYITGQGQRKEPIRTAQCWLPATLALGYHAAALQIIEELSTGSTRLRGRMVTIDLAARETREHVLVKRPQCPRCGEPPVGQAGRLAGKSAKPQAAGGGRQPKRCRGDGGHRTLTPAETYERFKHHVSPILGAVTELMPALGPWHELTPTFVAGHNFSMGVDSIVFLRESVRGMSGGKGVTEIQAKVSGLCEALERYSGIYAGDEVAVRGSYVSLQPDAIHPNDCMGFSAEQIRIRMEWNTTQPHSRCHLIPHPLDEQMEIDWTPLWSLTHERVRYLPTAFCYYGHPEFRGRWCSPDSNGTAAGNTPEEAILQGFLELVERDAAAIWWYNRLRRRAVDLASFDNPYLDAIQDHYQSLERDLWVLDITSDLPVATFACLSHHRNRPCQDILLGFGSHFDPAVALLRAITEVNQFLPSVTLTNPDGSTRYLFGDELARRWWKTATLEENPYLLPDLDVPPAKRSDFHDPSSDDLVDDVRTCVELVRSRDMEMLVLDQTRPDIGLSVVKVVVPQLCHFWRRFGKQRLYDVPVNMGFRQRPLRADEFNPHSIFF
jgi:ribosomal protein S12 methylthiotransferase accessory factor